MKNGEVYTWLPGCGFNHANSENLHNVHMRCTKDGVYEVVAIRDISAGDELLRDYTSDYGESPQWFEKFVKESVERGLMKSSVFPEMNEFV